MLSYNCFEKGDIIIRAGKRFYAMPGEIHQELVLCASATQKAKQAHTESEGE